MRVFRSQLRNIYRPIGLFDFKHGSIKHSCCSIRFIRYLLFWKLHGRKDVVRYNLWKDF